MRPAARVAGLSPRRRALITAVALAVIALAAVRRHPARPVRLGARRSVRVAPQPCPARPGLRRQHDGPEPAGGADPGHRAERHRRAAGRRRHGRSPGPGARAERLREPGPAQRVGPGHRDRLLRRRRGGLAVGRRFQGRREGAPVHHPGLPAARRQPGRPRRGVRPGGVPDRMPAARPGQRPAERAADLARRPAAVAVPVDHRRPGGSAPRLGPAAPVRSTCPCNRFAPGSASPTASCPPTRSWSASCSATSAGRHQPHPRPPSAIPCKPWAAVNSHI